MKITLEECSNLHLVSRGVAGAIVVGFAWRARSCLFGRALIFVSRGITVRKVVFQSGCSFNTGSWYRGGGTL